MIEKVILSLEDNPWLTAVPTVALYLSIVPVISLLVVERECAAPTKGKLESKFTNSAAFNCVPIPVVEVNPIVDMPTWSFPRFTAYTLCPSTRAMETPEPTLLMYRDGPASPTWYFNSCPVKNLCSGI